MNAIEISFGIVILLQFSIGVSVNMFSLLFYTCMVSDRYKLSSSDLLLTHLILANTVMLFTSGISETMHAWGLRDFLDNVGCKIIMYLYRVARGLAICTTYFLSIFQAITISPSTSQWAGIKTKFPKYILPSCILSWILNMLVEIDVLIYMTGPQNSSSVWIILDLKYCSKASASAEIALMIVTVRSLRDVFFVGLMSAASSYMVFILHRHHRRVQHLRRPGHSTRMMPEVQAARRVIALVTLYVLLYGRQSIVLSILLNMKEKSSLLVNSHMVFSLTFATVSPILMIINDRRIHTIWKREPPVSNTDIS
ncbi:vomeronasal 1 receptor ornAnaV1R3147 [Ornithorhynchus anatinus]|uniref:Vomeronasal type-1 receptor n=1 Tax=Ornithorhynchus anatinus TaxID=9258 RepID=A0A6I8NHX0_ORNAN|nr:vomeronasal 1 receptor ornAnaV1R3147 [Ornithorhynchus anatinus]